ncbi:hypothetical protein HZS_970 [Henneguya salminicola]|nr:hypothetical protein HZS_970 [Henneguya salminicola]
MNFEIIFSEHKKTLCSSKCLTKICPNAMHTYRDRNLFLNNPTVHNHALNPDNLSKRRIISDVRIRARTTPKPPRRLLADCLSQSIPSVLPLILSYNSLQLYIQMISQRINLSLTLPSDAAHLIISEQYKISIRNKNVRLYYDPENDGERFIIFTKPRQLNILSRSSSLFFYSTFKPVVFYSRRIQKFINSICFCVN